MGNLYPDRFGVQQLNWITEDQIVFSLPPELLARLDEARGDLSRGDAVEAVISSLLKGTAEINPVRNTGDPGATAGAEPSRDLDDVDFSQDYFELLENADEQAAPGPDRVVGSVQAPGGAHPASRDGAAGRETLRRTIRRQRWSMAACVAIAIGGIGYSALLGQKVNEAGSLSAQLATSRAQLRKELNVARAESNDLVLKLAHVERSLERARAEIELTMNATPTVSGLGPAAPAPALPAAPAAQRESAARPVPELGPPPPRALSGSVSGDLETSPAQDRGAVKSRVEPRQAALPDFGPVRADSDGDALPAGTPFAPALKASPKSNSMVAAAAPLRLPPPPPRKPPPPPLPLAAGGLGAPGYGISAPAPTRLPAAIPEAARNAFPVNAPLPMPPGGLIVPGLTAPPDLLRPGAASSANEIPVTPRFDEGPAAQAGRALPQRAPRRTLAPVPTPGVTTNFGTGDALPRPGRKSNLAVGGALSN